MMKAQRSKKRAILASLKWRGDGCFRCSIYFVQDRRLDSSSFVSPRSLPHTTTALPERLEIAPREDHHKFYLPSKLIALLLNFSELPNARK